MENIDTIAALATAPGHSGVGIIRVSGPAVLTIIEAIIGHSLTPRYAHYGSLYIEHGLGRDAVRY